MSVTTSEQRRITILGDASRLDLIAPVGHTLAQSLADAGITFTPGHEVLVDRSGREVSPATAISSLDDGALVTIVDVSKGPGEASATRTLPHVRRADHHSTWWLLAVGAVLLVAGALSALASQTTLLDGPQRLWIAAGLALGAVVTASLWIARAPDDAWGAPALVATLTLAFAAGALAVPVATSSVHLAITVGLLAAATLGSAMAVAARSLVLRAIATTLAIQLLVYAGIWGATLLLEWDVVAPAAITLGLVVPGIRFLPTALLPLADGYLINYKHFMSSRWTVRGSIPDEPGVVSMAAIRPSVAVAAARLRTGTVALCVSAPIVAPTVMAGMDSQSLLVRVGSIGVVIVTALALALMPRRGSDPVAAWASRGAAALLVVETAVLTASGTSDAAISVLAIVLLGSGMLAAGLIVPVSKGVRSLGWSRFGDAIEALSVAFALPLALLAANTIELVREMMSG